MVKSISIPKTPKSAYDPTRKVSTLLKAHIANLEAVTHRKLGVKPSKKPRTEAQASAYIAELTQQLHPAVQSAPVPVPAAAVPPSPVMPGATRVTTKRKIPTRARSKTTRRVTKASRTTRRAARRGKATRARGAKK